MKKFTQLNLGFANAENYRRRANKELLSRYFVRDEYLDKILDPNVYFLVGEKGTGKTAYSTYLVNNKYKNKNSFAYDVRQTEYQKFLELKKMGHLPLSHYSEIWRTLLLILSATSIIESSSTPAFLQKFTKLKAVKQAIDEFYNKAFSPEIVKILSFVESSERSSSLIAKYLGIESGIKDVLKSEKSDSLETFQINLLQIRRAFEEALSSLKLDEDFVIFIDGIDVRPSEISYTDYFDCVRGLIEAVWAINNDFLADIKDSAGRIRVVLLVRPDIFLRAGLHNVNTKIRDNSVFLNWSTTYKDYRTSSLFKVADKMLSVQQENSVAEGVAWDHYFPFSTASTKYLPDGTRVNDNSFISFLRFCYYRPRDINAMLRTMQEILQRKGDFDIVSTSDFDDPSFRDAHADYLLGEIRDQLLFYYSQDEFDLFLQFFSHLNGKKRFSYSEFVSAFNGFVRSCADMGKNIPAFFESDKIFLQFLYEQNVICFIEDDEEGDGRAPFIRWCFRERNPSNLSPKVRPEVDYEIFYGLTKALNVGREIKTKITNVKREIGTVASVNYEKGFGFIRGGATQADYYFKIDASDTGFVPRLGQRVSYEPKIKYGKLRAISIRRG